MKEAKRFIIAGLMALSLVSFTMSMFKVFNEGISLFNIIKIGTTDYNVGWDMLGDFTYELQSYIRPVSFLLIFVILITIGAAIGTALLKGRAGYMITIVGVAFSTILLLGICVGVKFKLDSALEQLSYFGIQTTCDLGIGALLIWFVTHGAAVVLAIVGLIEKVEPVEQKQKVPPVEASVEETIISDDSEVEGAIVGVYAPYKGMVYRMKNHQLYFWVKEDGQVSLVEDPGNDKEVLAEIYYVQEYKEYVVKPMDRKTVFLRSRQPLGANRIYYLKKNTGIYVMNEDYSFTLA